MGCDVVVPVAVRQDAGFFVWYGCWREIEGYDDTVRVRYGRRNSAGSVIQCYSHRPTHIQTRI